MEAIEGKRSMPRFRPPFPAAYGVWGKPSNINNIKTLSYAPEIVRRGAEWFSGIGTEKSTGTAIACLSGDIRYPGLVEVPFGLTVRDVIERMGGGETERQGAQVPADRRPARRSAPRRAVRHGARLRRDGRCGRDVRIGRPHRLQRGAFRGRPHTRPCRVRPDGVVRQVLPVQAWYEPHPGDTGAHRGREGPLRRHGADGARRREHARGLALRPRPARLQPGLERGALLRQRVRGAVRGRSASLGMFVGPKSTRRGAQMSGDTPTASVKPDFVMHVEPVSTSPPS